MSDFHSLTNTHTENPVVKLIALDHLKMQTLLCLTHRYLWQRQAKENNKKDKTGRKSTWKMQKKKRKKQFEEGTSGTIMQIGLHQVTHSGTSVTNFVWPRLVWQILSVALLSVSFGKRHLMCFLSQKSNLR